MESYIYTYILYALLIVALGTAGYFAGTKWEKMGAWVGAGVGVVVGVGISAGFIYAQSQSDNGGGGMMRF